MSCPNERQVPAAKRCPPHLAQRRDPLRLEFAAGVLIKKNARARARAMLIAKA
jgi:hypothetical protein